jgi:hypothetical protein
MGIKCATRSVVKRAVCPIGHADGTQKDPRVPLRLVRLVGLRHGQAPRLCESRFAECRVIHPLTGEDRQVPRNQAKDGKTERDEDAVIIVHASPSLGAGFERLKTPIIRSIGGRSQLFSTGRVQPWGCHAYADWTPAERHRHDCEYPAKPFTER